MPLQVNSSGWRIKQGGTSRGGTRPSAADTLKGLPQEFLTTESSIAEEVILEPAATSRGGGPAAGSLDFSYDVEPGKTAILAIRHPSGALTFHQQEGSTSRGTRGAQARFKVDLQPAATRGIVDTAIKAVVIKVAKAVADKATGLIVSKAAEVMEGAVWKKRGLKEGWLKVTKDTLASGKLAPGRPESAKRSLLFIHGTFSNAAAAYRALADTHFFDEIKSTYADRIFAFDHFTLSRTPEQNARMLLEGLPAHTTTFDVITHSRGGLVLRNLVERADEFGKLSSRFKLGRAVLVAAPNGGTPLATPKRWEDTVGWMANLLDWFPVDNPFTSGAAFVGDGLVWLANHAAVDLPGLHAMNQDGEPIKEIQGPPDPPAEAYSALVANYQPTGKAMQRLLDMGVDRFFESANDLVVPSEGGWRTSGSETKFVAAARIGCFGPGGNLRSNDVTHFNFFSQPATTTFLVNGLLGREQKLGAIDPGADLSTAGSARRGMSDAAARPGRRPSRADAGQGEQPLLKIGVTNGDLTFVRQGLLIGHYESTQLTGTEKAMDYLLDGKMSRSLAMGAYPVLIGSHQIFLNSKPNPKQNSVLPRPEAVIVVGLGEEGKLQSPQLVQTVRQAVIAWAQRLADQDKAPKDFKVATTLIGSGGAGISPGDAARLVAQGVYDAHTAILDDDNADLPHVSHLEFIELYLDRATEAWRALCMQDAATPGRYDLDDVVKPGTGALQRPPESGYRGSEFEFISVETRRDRGGAPLIEFTLDTKRARSEVRGQRAQSRLLRKLVETASNDQHQDDQIGRTLFDLLVPVELEPYLAGQNELQMVLDPQTAQIPWELLDTRRDSKGGDPWSIRVKLLRKLRISEFRERVRDAGTEDGVLIIGEPECPKGYPRLAGARHEAEAVRDCLESDEKIDVKALISDGPPQVGPDLETVLNALFEQRWRIVHIAGHGVQGEGTKPGGVVLSSGTFLGPDEFSKLRTVPELVFVNCCHLASSDAEELLNVAYDRAKFASGVAGELIKIGVRCVIAAGWAVEDAVARVFAEQFYQALMTGSRFIDAVHLARKAAYEQNTVGNTWAAYQCYGDPDWVFRRGDQDSDKPDERKAADFSGVVSQTQLQRTLERIIVRTKFQGAAVQDQLKELEALKERSAGKKWTNNGAVAALFAEAFVEAGELAAGIEWYQKALEAPKGGAAMKAAEQLANIRGRYAWELVDGATRHLDQLEKGKASRRELAAAKSKLAKSVEQANALIDSSLELLAKLIAVIKTMERLSLVGSAHKRRALIAAATGRVKDIPRHIEQMRRAYEEAHQTGKNEDGADLYYPASNQLVADVVLKLGSRRGLDRELTAFLRKYLKDKDPEDADFWSVVGKIELDQFEALMDGKLAAARPKLEGEYEDLHKRVTATRSWGSVYDTACLILPKYKGNSKERKAADDLLSLLRGYAHPKAT